MLNKGYQILMPVVFFIGSVTLQYFDEVVLVIPQITAFPEQLSRLPFMADKRWRCQREQVIQALVMSSYSFLWKGTYTDQ